MQNVVDRARIPLNDDKTAGSDATCRWSDVKLLGYANDAVLVLRMKRPDIFIGQYEALPGPNIITDNIPVPDEYFVALADYATARAETPDDEAAVMGRAQLFFGLFAASEGAR